jgi:hypothetical protein
MMVGDANAKKSMGADVNVVRVLRIKLSFYTV